MFSVSKSAEGAVKTYIETQAEHHRTRNFNAELMALLKAHGVEFDPKYAFG